MEEKYATNIDDQTTQKHSAAIWFKLIFGSRSQVVLLDAYVLLNDVLKIVYDSFEIDKNLEVTVEYVGLDGKRWLIANQDDMEKAILMYEKRRLPFLHIFCKTKAKPVTRHHEIKRKKPTLPVIHEADEEEYTAKEKLPEKKPIAYVTPLYPPRQDYASKQFNDAGIQEHRQTMKIRQLFPPAKFNTEEVLQNNQNFETSTKQKLQGSYSREYAHLHGEYVPRAIPKSSRIEQIIDDNQKGYYRNFKERKLTGGYVHENPNHMFNTAPIDKNGTHNVMKYQGWEPNNPYQEKPLGGLQLKDSLGKRNGANGYTYSKHYALQNGNSSQVNNPYQNGWLQNNFLHRNNLPPLFPMNMEENANDSHEGYGRRSIRQKHTYLQLYEKRIVLFRNNL